MLVPSFFSGLLCWQDLMCVLGWLNHPGVRFQFSTRGWTATGHPLQLNTIVIDLSQLVCHNFCADISDSQQCTYFFFILRKQCSYSYNHSSESMITYSKLVPNLPWLICLPNYQNNSLQKK
jgi:hypothetical protein